jgi:hypothetical protein
MPFSPSEGKRLNARLSSPLPSGRETMPVHPHDGFFYIHSALAQGCFAAHFSVFTILFLTLDLQLTGK